MGHNSTGKVLRMLAVTACILFMGLSAEAKKVKVSDGKVIYTLDTSAKTASVTGFEDKAVGGKVTILDYILNAEDGKTYKVTAIASKAFQSAFLTSVSIPATIETIGSYAFETCSLSKLTLPDNLKIVGAYAFCEAIDGKTAIDLIIPAGCTAIKAYAFNSCNIRSVRFNSKLTTLGEFSFAATSLTSVEVPASVTDLGDGVFAGCHELQKAVVSTPITTVPVQFFDGCSSLTEISLPASVTSIGKWAFSECTALKTFSWPKGLKTIADYGFYKSGLQSITFPDGIQTLGEHAFSFMPSLTEVTVPASMTAINNYCFNGSEKIKDVYINNPKPCTLGTCGFDTNTYRDAMLHVPAGSEEAYQYAKEWECFRNYYDHLATGISSPEAVVARSKVVKTDGSCIIEGAYGKELRIFEMSGRMVKEIPCYHGESIELGAGIYLVTIHSPR